MKATLSILQVFKQPMNHGLGALRVLAMAYKDIDYVPDKNNEAHLEDRLVFIGLMGMIDHQRRSERSGTAV